MKIVNQRTDPNSLYNFTSVYFSFFIFSLDKTLEMGCWLRKHDISLSIQQSLRQGIAKKSSYACCTLILSSQNYN